MKKTTILCIFDGFGLRSDTQGNAIAHANMPTFRRLLQEYPWTTLDADGDSVGQEKGLVGNSEVGHMNLGGLQLVKQLSYQVTESAHNLYDNDNLRDVQNFDPKEMITSVTHNDVSVHIVGLFSTATVHSDMRHWAGAIMAASISGAKNIVLHIVSDGRDSDRQSLVKTWTTFVSTYRDMFNDNNTSSHIKLGSIGGRFYTMDRDNNIERTLEGMSAIINSKGNTTPYNGTFDGIATTIQQVASASYAHEVYDEHIVPVSTGYAPEKHDVVWLINVRSDRMKQITHELVEYNKSSELDLCIIANNSYGIGCELIIDQMNNRSEGYFPIFTPHVVKNTLAQRLESMGKNQLHIAETEKYAHVTYFFDGGINEKQEHETWHIIASNKVASHDQMPLMKAKDVTDYILQEGLGEYDFIVVNYANPDMIGHTGNYDAGIQTLEHLDTQLKRLIDVIERDGHTMVLTADHGNIEEVGKVTMNSDEVDTKHNPNPVPCIFISSKVHLAEILEHLSGIIKDNNFMIEPQRIYDNIVSDSAAPQGEWFSPEEISEPTLPLWCAGLIAFISVATY